MAQFSDSEKLTVSRDALIVDGSDLMFREMLHNLLAFSARLEQIRGGFANLIGLSGPQYTILITVQQLSQLGDVGVGHVAEHLALTPAFVTKETKNLLKLGVLEKEPDPNDLRRVKLKVTRYGETKLQCLPKVQQQVNDQLFKAVTQDNFAMLHALSADLRNDAEKALSMLRFLALEEESA